MQATRGTGRHAGELLTAIAYVLSASILFYALRTRSTAYQQLVEASHMLYWSESILALAGIALAGGRLGRLKASVTTTDLVRGGAMFLGLLLLVGYLFFGASIQILMTYGGLLAARVWTVITAPRNEIIFFQIRSGVAFASIFVVLAIAWQQSGAGMEPPFLIAGLAWYFVILAVGEIALLLERGRRHRSSA